jgi:tRNA (mo5U34)-methyltransferase
MSGHADPFAYVEDWRRQFSETGWWHSFELPDGSAIAGVSSLESQKSRIARFPIPADLSGKRVLDIGAWDGWFTFEMERRGAEVVAIDRWDNPRFREIHAALGSRAEYRQMNVYELNPAKLGQFDLVLFLGVLYHLKHPLLALERVCSMTKDFAAVESFALTRRYLPAMDVEEYSLLQFFERDGFGGQFDNWFAFTPRCLVGMCRTAGFARADLIEVHEFGAAVACYRHWEQHHTPGAVSSLKPAPQLFTAVHAENFGVNFRSTDDDCVQCEAADDEPWTIENVQAETGGFGAAPVSTAKTPDGHWRCNFKLPPGLAAGWHDVRVRRSGSQWSNPARIAIDVPERAIAIEIAASCDAFHWTPNSFSLTHRFFSLWIRGLGENADRANVKVELEGRRQSVDFVGPYDPTDAAGLRQINVLADARLRPGRYRVRAEFGSVRSPEFEITATLP